MYEITTATLANGEVIPFVVMSPLGSILAILLFVLAISALSWIVKSIAKRFQKRQLQGVA